MGGRVDVEDLVLVAASALPSFWQDQGPAEALWLQTIRRTNSRLAGRSTRWIPSVSRGRRAPRWRVHGVDDGGRRASRGRIGGLEGRVLVDWRFCVNESMVDLLPSTVCTSCLTLLSALQPVADTPTATSAATRNPYGFALPCLPPPGNPPAPRRRRRCEVTAARRSAWDTRGCRPR